MPQTETYRGRDLRHMREAAGLRQPVIAEEAGINTQLLIAIEKERVIPNEAVEKQIVDAITRLSAESAQ